jgi:acetyl esterase/lipase
MNRRHFLFLSAAALLAGGRLRAAESQQTIRLWPGVPPGGGGPDGPVRLSARGALSHIAQPELTVWRPAAPRGHGVLIAAGGGYRRIEMAKEAWPAARWLTMRGYTAYVLTYRLPGRVASGRPCSAAGRSAGAAPDSSAGSQSQPSGVFRRRTFVGNGCLSRRFCLLLADRRRGRPRPGPTAPR